MATYRRRRRPRGRSDRISATEAAKTFGRLVDRVREERATYVIERGGRPVAQIGPVETRLSTMKDFIAFVRDIPRAPGADPEYLRAVEDGIRRFNKPRVPDNPWER